MGPSQSFEFVADDADVCGVDEAGRGPLAGPVVAAAVVLDRKRPIDGLRDSKLLTALQRVRLAGEIRRNAKAPAFHAHARLYRAEPIIDGDNLLPEISAASILAKVCRDRLMCRLHRRYPRYGFDENKGYATAEHLRALEEFGPCAIHRTTFAPVRESGAEHVRC